MEDVFTVKKGASAHASVPAPTQSSVAPAVPTAPSSFPAPPLPPPSDELGPPPPYEEPDAADEGWGDDDDGVGEGAAAASTASPAISAVSIPAPVLSAGAGSAVSSPAAPGSHAKERFKDAVGHVIATTRVVDALKHTAAAMRACDELALAARDGDLPAMRRFLAAGAGVNDTVDVGGTALTQAAAADQLPALLFLLDEAHADVDAVTAGGHSVVAIAAEKGHERIVRALLAHGAKISLADRVSR